MSAPITYDLSASGGPKEITLAELTHLAAVAKEKVKATARGWGLLSQIEIIALAWLADQFLQDIVLAAPPPAPPPAKPEPAVISNV